MSLGDDAKTTNQNITRQTIMRHHGKLLLKLQTIANDSQLSWQKINAVEIGNTKTRDVYEELLNFYDKDVKIELIDKNR